MRSVAESQAYLQATPADRIESKDNDNGDDDQDDARRATKRTHHRLAPLWSKLHVTKNFARFSSVGTTRASSA